MAQLPKGGLVTGYNEPIHGSCAIYVPGGIIATSHVIIPCIQAVYKLQGLEALPQVDVSWVVAWEAQSYNTGSRGFFLGGGKMEGWRMKGESFRVKMMVFETIFVLHFCWKLSES